MPSIVALLLLLGTLLAGCGSNSGSPGSPGPYATSASCDTQSTNSQCRDWSNPAGTTDFAYSCSGMTGGTYSTAVCASNNRVGSCTLAPILGNTAVYRYYSTGAAPYDTTTAPAHCSSLSGTYANG